MFGDIIGNKDSWKKMPFYLLKNNKDLLFAQKEFLINNLEVRTGSDKYTYLFSLAYDYFVENPEDYDGASGDQELDTITDKHDNNIRYRYCISSIIHDYLDVCGFTKDIKNMDLNNILFDKLNNELGLSVFNIEKRKLVSLKIVNYARILIRKFKGNDKKNIYTNQLDTTVRSLIDGYKIKWKGWNKASLFVISLLVLLIII